MKTPRCGRNQGSLRLALALVLAVMIPIRSFGVSDPPPPPPPPEECEPGCCDPVCTIQGQLTNPGLLSTNSLVICVGGSATASVLGTTFDPGQTTKYCTNSDCTTYTETEAVVYTATNWWAPPLPATFGSCGVSNFAAWTKGLPGDTNCSPTEEAFVGSLTVRIVKVDDASATGATEVDDGDGNPDTKTYVTCRGTGSVTVCATTCPSDTTEAQLAGLGCWVTSGGVGTNKLCRTVPRTNAGPQTVTFSAGGATKTVTVAVQELRLTPASTNVFVNADDDNGNGTNDLADATTLAITGENDLVRLDLTLLHNPVSTQLVTLSVSPVTTPSGRVRVWDNPARGPNPPWLDNGDPARCSTNWPASSLPASVWVEGMAPSATVNEVNFTLSAAFGCAVSTNLTVVNVTSVAWQTNALQTNLLSNTALGGPGGGLAIYPDRPTPTNTGNYSAVGVVAQISPPMAGIELFFRAFDVDDPSNGLTNAPPLDDETAGTDNRGTSPDGNFNLTLLTDTNGVVRTNFHVSMQPGDNFRIVASPLADFRGHCTALQSNDHGALVFGSSTNEIPSNCRTEMMTVWRRLHVEVDSMAAVTNNRVTGNIERIAGNGTGATNVILGVNLRTGLTPSDSSPNLSTTPSGNGRFENGWIAIGTSTNTGLMGSGDNFVRLPAGATFNIPFTLTDANGSNAVSGQVWDFRVVQPTRLFAVDTLLVTNRYNGGTIQVAGHTFNVLQNHTNSVRVPLTSTLPFTLHDDDSDTQLPHLVWPLATPYAEAFITLVASAPTNTQTNVAVIINLGDDTSVLTANFNEMANGADDYWVACLLGCCQYLPHQTFTTGTIGDQDPNAESGVGGLATGADVVGHGGGFGAFVYLETIQDRLANSGADSGLADRVTTHELGHALGLPHNSVGGIMFPSVQRALPNGQPFRFIPSEFDILRSRVRSPGR